MSEIYAIWLSLCENIGNTKAKLLIDYFGDAEKVYNAGEDELSSIKGIGAFTLKELLNKDLSDAEAILNRCRDENFRVIDIMCKEYPEKLRNIYDPPTVLYVKGQLPDTESVPVIGVVGTRWCTPYGYKNTESICYDLAQNGIIVATGLAKGIDTAAAYGAVEGGGSVIGVIGCGIDIVYPPQNRKLFEMVTQRGAVISEYRPGTVARPEFFPSRNRIISGLSNGVAVIEAPERSGALITAEQATQQGRDVFVLPGNVGARACAGSNKLLRLGAIPFMSAEDIIDEYRDLYDALKKPIDNKAAVDYIDVSNNEEIQEEEFSEKSNIIDILRQDALHADEIITITGLSAQIALSLLTELELDGYVRRDINGKWESI